MKVIKTNVIEAKYIAAKGKLTNNELVMLSKLPGFINGLVDYDTLPGVYHKRHCLICYFDPTIARLYDLKNNPLFKYAISREIIKTSK